MASCSNQERSLPWKERPCHFTWKLKVNVLTDYDKIIRNIDHDLIETPNLLRVESLLFRAYLEVCDYPHYCNYPKASKFLQEAEECIEAIDRQLQQGYKSVALLNRIWIEHKTAGVEKLITDLDDIKLAEKDMCVVDAVHATALSRLGPKMATEALQLFKTAAQQFPQNENFLYGTALMTGTRMRFTRDVKAHYKDMDKDGQELMDDEKELWGKMMDVNDEYGLAKSGLGLNLTRRGETEINKGRELLEEAFAETPKIGKVCGNLVRYLREKNNIQRAIEVLKMGSSTEPHNSEFFYQIARCYMKQAKQESRDKSKRKQLNEKALREIENCLKLNKEHEYALIGKAKVYNFLHQLDKAKEVYESRIQQSDRLTPENNLDLHYNYAMFLERTRVKDAAMEIWQKVMNFAMLLEYHDNTSGKWQVSGRGQTPKNDAFSKLKDHYEPGTLERGILLFQNFDFKAAKEIFKKLDPETYPDASVYLAKTCRKWGLQLSVQAFSEKSKEKRKEATDCFREARENIRLAKPGQHNPTEIRTLLADVALASAHNSLDEARPQGDSSESDCIESYREAVRCGSLTASVELLRILEKDYLKITPRVKFLQILAEIDACCSQDSKEYLHGDSKPLSFREGISSHDTDDDSSALDAIMIKRSVRRVLRWDDFFGQAWKEHFTMERTIIQETFENDNGDLKQDGRAVDKPANLSEEVLHAAIDCLQKLRPLLDHKYREFMKKELNIQDYKIQVYFPLFRGETKNPSSPSGGNTSTDSKEKTEKLLQKELQKVFKSDIQKRYPKLFKQLLEVQPGYDSQYLYLQNFWEIVNTVKHSTRNLKNILSIEKDLVLLARRCTDKVEEICGFFTDAMNTKDLRNHLLAKIKDEKHGKVDELLEHLRNYSVFSVAWKLEMLEVFEMSEGNLVFSKKLRQCHLDVELSVIQTDSSTSEEVLQCCTATCKEVDEVLSSVLTPFLKQTRATPPPASVPATSPTTQNPQGASSPAAFPFEDSHPGEESLQQNGRDQWKGKVKKNLHKCLKKMGIPCDVNANTKLLEIILKAQPCTDEANYRFIAMRVFLSSNGHSDFIKITTNNGEEKEFQVLELTRWCVDKAERIAIELDKLTSAAAN